MIRIGIIGTGFGVRSMIPTFKKIKGCQVVALAGTDLKKTKKITLENNIKFAYDNYQDLIKNPQVDLVCNPTPSHLHLEIGLLAIKHKKHLLQEKPAGLNSNQIKKLVKASKKSKKFIGVNHTSRFNPVTLKIKKLIDSGVLGQITSISIHNYVNYGSFKDATYTWWDDHKKSGGQTVLGYGTHLIDLARYLTNFPRLEKGFLHDQIISKTQPDKITGKHKKVTSPDQFRANIKFNNQINVSLFATLYSFGYNNFELKILGTKGIIFYDDLNGLQISTDNSQPLQLIKVQDHLSDINVGRSFVSKSFKFLAENLINYLNGDIKKFEYCTPQQAWENQQILEKICK
ncbi:Gfo/Idh/MocA family oxidoreductase [Patescibacteria group bacterium]|nr:Gfo/Idh/MocA family oxidoreductase [Patescibacteria group bacterium]